jgi:glycosidase
MNHAAIYHRSQDNWCYPLDSQRLHIRLQTAVNDVENVELVSGDPFDWAQSRWQTSRQAMKRSGQTAVHQYWEAEVEPDWKRTKYFFLIHSRGAVWELGERGLLESAAGMEALSPEQYRNAFNFPYINEADLYRAPDWVESTVWYQVFPERFANGNPALNPPGTKTWHRGPVTNREFYGGDLPGLVGKLDHIAALGCNGLYLTPVFASPSVHKYDTIDYQKIDPAFGTEDDLRALVKGCHERGIRLILDAVFNHSGVLFAPWQDVLKHRDKSRYADWFCIHDFDKLTPDAATANRQLGYATFAFAAGMPKLNTANLEVREYLLKATRHWMTFGIDGWRLDVANEVDHDFWREYRKVVKRINPDAYIVGEIWHDSMRWLRGDQYDAVMNYRYGNAVSDFVLGLNRMDSALDFAQAIDGIDISYPLPVLRHAFNVLDSHDTNRFITRCGGDKVRARLGWLLLFLLRGSPCVYYGSEVGMEGGDDPDNRRCMVWEPEHQDLEQLEFLRGLTKFRIGEAELVNHGARKWVLDAAQPDLLGLAIEHKGRTLTVKVNRSAIPQAGLGAWGYRLDWS